MSKIAIIHSIYKPDIRGGAEVVVENIVEGLKEKGEDVFVISVGRENKKENVDGVEVYRIKPFNFFNFLDINQKPKWLRFFWHIWDMFNDVQVWRVYKVLKEEKPDVVMTHNLKGLGYYIPWLLRIMKVKHIHTIHDAQLLHPSGLTNNNANLSFFARFYAFCSKKLFGSPRVVIFPSQYSMGIYGKWGFFKNSQKVVLGNPIEKIKGIDPRAGSGHHLPSANERKRSKLRGINSFDVCDARKCESFAFPLHSLSSTIKNPKLQIINKSQIKNPKLQILFLGQVEEYKGILNLIESVKRLKDLNIILHVVGSGKVFQVAKDLAGALLDDKIFFYGRLNHKELEEDIWPRVDILVNPTKVPESFGMVVVEAFAHGVPVIVSKIGALPELVNDDCGFLIEHGNVDELIEKIKFVLDNQEKLLTMGKNCLEAASYYDAQDYLNKLMDFSKIDRLN